jgi:hypothetical protein
MRIARVLLLASVIPVRAAFAQTTTGTLIGTVFDSSAKPIPGVAVSLSSPALIGGPVTVRTDAAGHFRFPAIPPGLYGIAINDSGFASHEERRIAIRAGETIERLIVAASESIVVEASGPELDARDSGFNARFGPRELQNIPTRRSSMFDFIRSAPGVSPTSASSGTVTTMSVFGSGTNENAYLIDGTNFTCPCNGIARAEPGIDFIHEIQIQTAGESAEYGNIQGGVINVVTRQGGEQFSFDTSHYLQTRRLTSQPVRLDVPDSGGRTTGYERVRYRDHTADLGGAAIRNRLWFFTGYQFLRDDDSQPGTDAARPRAYAQDKFFAKLTWHLASSWTLVQSFHHERWSNPDQPTIARPYDATLRVTGSVPATTYGHLTDVVSPNTTWDARIGRFVYSQVSRPATGSVTTPGRTDAVTRIASGAPLQFGDLTLIRGTAKATFTQFHGGIRGADHEWKAGVQIEQGSHDVTSVIPSGVRFVDRNGQPSQKVSRAPFHIGGRFNTAGIFATDAVTFRDRLTMNAGLRFDSSRAISQDLPGIDLEGRRTADIIPGLGTLYRWSVFSPRLGVAARLAADGRTVLRASYGRFHQGIMSGELDAFHPGSTTTTTTDARTGAVISVVDPRRNLAFDPHTRPPFTDEFSAGIDRHITRLVTASVGVVHKSGRDFIGWSDIAGRYLRQTRTLANGVTIPVLVLDTSSTPTSARRFLLTNQPDYFMRYDGLVLAFEKTYSDGWRASGSYTLSRATGLQPSAGTAAGAQVSTVSPPTAAAFGRDPNDLTNARGRLANDRPHMLRLAGTFRLPRTAFALGVSFQYLSGKPWAATALVNLPQNTQQRVQVEPRGARRLSSQTLLDLRLSRTMHLAKAGEIELLLDVLNALNDSGEEGLVTETLATESIRTVDGFGRPNVFLDPRRAMVGVRFRFGQ